MELWTQTQPFALTRRSLRHGARDHDGGRIAVERLLKACITSVHVRNQNTLGSAHPCIDGRACLSLGGNRMDGLASCFSAATRTCFVFDRALAGLSAARLFHLVVQVRCLRADDIHARRGHRRERWDRSHGHRHCSFGLAGERSPARHDIRIGAVGRYERGSSCPTASCLAVWATAICGTMVPSTFCVLRRPGRERGSVLSFRPS